MDWKGNCKEKTFSPSLNKAVYYKEVDIKMTVMMQDETFTGPGY